jgi:hypothetical protein
MSMTIEQTDAAILATFHSMEEGVDYVLNDHWFSEMNRVRKEYNYSLFKNKQEWKFSRKSDKLFVNGICYFDFDRNSNIAFTFATRRADLQPITFTFPCTTCFSYALQHNGLEKLKTDTCEGKVVEIDGRKYKLTAV